MRNHHRLLLLQQQLIQVVTILLLYVMMIPKTFVVSSFQKSLKLRNGVPYYYRYYQTTWRRSMIIVPSKRSVSSIQQHQRCHMSVSGIIYQSDELLLSNNNNNNATKEIIITLYTKEGCTLCDVVQRVLSNIRQQYPHTLIAVDITDPIHYDIWFERYKYDIPVLHMNGIYWTKHRITQDEAIKGIMEISQGLSFQPIGVEPNAQGSRPKNK